MPPVLTPRTYTEELTGKRSISYQEFLDLPEDVYAEWVDGEVVRKMSVSILHGECSQWLNWVLMGFVVARRLGKVFVDPVQMRPGPGLPGRQPDIMFVAQDHLHRIRPQHVEGPSDLAIEIVSAESTLERGEKYREYESGGVSEYWIVDPEGEVAEFYQADARGQYQRIEPTPDGVYRCREVEGFWLKVSWLWERPSPADTLALILAGPA
jgi:Uma2 family endonuclease